MGFIPAVFPFSFSLPPFTLSPSSSLFSFLHPSLIPIPIPVFILFAIAISSKCKERKQRKGFGGDLYKAELRNLLMSILSPDAGV